MLVLYYLRWSRGCACEGGGGGGGTQVGLRNGGCEMGLRMCALRHPCLLATLLLPLASGAVTSDLDTSSPPQRPAARRRRTWVGLVSLVLVSARSVASSVALGVCGSISLRRLVAQVLPLPRGVITSDLGNTSSTRRPAARRRRTWVGLVSLVPVPACPAASFVVPGAGASPSPLRVAAGAA